MRELLAIEIYLYIYTYTYKEIDIYIYIGEIDRFILNIYTGAEKFP